MSRRRAAAAAAVTALVVLLAGCVGPLSTGVGTRPPASTAAASSVAPAPGATPSDLAAARKAAGIADCPASSNAPAVSGGLPDVTLECLGGGSSVRLAGVRGPMLINLWAQWCEPCRAESAHLAAFAKTQQKVAMLGIDYSDPQPELAIEFAQLTSMTYPHLADKEHVLKAPLGVVGIPYSILIDADGRIVARHPGQFISLENVQEWVAKGLAGWSTPVPPELRDAQARFARPDALSFISGAREPQGARRAAVLILLSQGQDGYDVVLIEKRSDLRTHAGQVAFPGGGIETVDVDPVAAALREAEEEVGVLPSSVVVLGVLPVAHIPRSGFDVTSVVGWWSDPVPLVPVDVREVAAVHHVPVSRLLDPANRSTWTILRGFAGPAFELDDLYIWGFTAYLLDGLFDLLGWTLPWDASRTTEIPPRFFSERL